MRFIRHPLVKLFTTLALLALVALKVDIAEAAQRLWSLPTLLMIAFTSVSFFALLVQAWKTKVLLPEQAVGSLLRVNIISQVYSVLFFGQLGGDIARTGYMTRSPGDLHRIVAAVLFDRITGLIGLLLLALGGLLTQAGRFDPVVAPALAASMTILLIGILATLGLRGAVVTRLLGRLPSRLATPLADTARAIRVFSSSPSTLMASIAMGVVFQAVVVVNCAWLGSALGIDLPWLAWPVVICVMSIVLLLPVAFAGIGLRDVTLVGLLGSYGVPSEQALALALALLGIQLAMVAVGGILMMLPRRDLSSI